MVIFGISRIGTGWLDWIMSSARDHRVHDHKRHAEHQTRDDAAQEKEADRGIRDQRVKHHRNRRRNDRPDDRGRGGDRAGIGDRIAVVLGHHADDDAADADGVGDRRARHTGENDIRHDIHVAEAAAKTADQNEAELQKPVSERADVHQIGRQDEQRHRKQDVAVEQPVEQLFGGSPQIQPIYQQIEDRGDDHRVADRQAGGSEQDDRDYAECKWADRHNQSLTLAGSVAGDLSPRMA